MTKKMHMRFLGFMLLISMSFAQVVTGQGLSLYKKIDTERLPNGRKFKFWEVPVKYSKTYYVDGKVQQTGDGSAAKPFKTINEAAQVVAAGERVVIKGGEYREVIHPAKGGTAADKMISYEAAEGEEVIVKGSTVLDPNRWTKSTAWDFYTTKKRGKRVKEGLNVWEYKFDGSEFRGYNPFGLINIMIDREWLDLRKAKHNNYFKRRGMLFLNGKSIFQAELSRAMGDSAHAFWPEHNGMVLHLMLPEGETPKNYTIEATNKEQVFVPNNYGEGYIRIKGITFKHAGNGFPVPQRGMVSAKRGHHWVIEGCTFEDANALGLDVGEEMWGTNYQPIIGHHVIRNNTFRNCGIGGVAGFGAHYYLVEGNLVENCGWQDAEHAFESGGMKFHLAIDMLFRRNVFRNLDYAPGLWLDNGNENCRVTQNLFTNIKTARGAIFLEVGHRQMQVDHNVINKMTSMYWLSGDYGAGGSGFYIDGQDSVICNNNLVMDCENMAYTSYLSADRMVEGRGGTARHHNITDNIFLDCRKLAVEIPNAYQHFEGNVYSKMPLGYLKIKYPEPSMLLDLKAWQDYYGWDKKGAVVKTEAYSLDPQTLELTLQIKDLPQAKDKPATAGPFRDHGSLNKVNVDPRR